MLILFILSKIKTVSYYFRVDNLSLVRIKKHMQAGMLKAKVNGSG